MIIYYMDEEAYNYLTEWSEENRIRTRFCSEYCKKSKVVMKDFNKKMEADLTFYAERVKDEYKFSITDEDGLIIKGRLISKHDGEHDFNIKFEFKREFSDGQMDVCVHIMQVYTTAFAIANCFMWYGNLVDEKEYTPTGKNMENGNKVITFRKFNDTLYAVPIGHHRSPEGVFAVRGHFRKYQNGKVIWIDSYLKGQD